MPAKAINEIVNLLDAGQAERAWDIFLETYGKSVMQTVHHYERDADLASDCFLHICEKLCENRFARLARFDSRKGAKFRTWLKLVVSRLCIDWQRSLFGRHRPSAAINRLPEFEQLVYHLRYELGLNLESAFQTIYAASPGKTREDMHAANKHIHESLSSRQRWNLANRRRRHVSVDTDRASLAQAGDIELAGIEPPPDLLVEMNQERERLFAGVALLDHEQRLLLRLRFQEDLPFREVARLSGLKDASQARHKIETALAALAALLTAILPAA